MITPVLGNAVMGCSLTEGRFLNISSPPLYHLTLYTCSPCHNDYHDVTLLVTAVMNIVTL